MTTLLIAVALVANGVAAGVMVSAVRGIVPLTMALPYDRYVETVRFLWPRYDPLMPVLNATALVADGALAFVSPTAKGRAFFAVAAMLLGGVLAISLVGNLPINRYVTALDPQCKPSDWSRRDPRARWRTWNLGRTACSVLALLAASLGARA